MLLGSKRVAIARQVGGFKIIPRIELLTGVDLCDSLAVLFSFQLDHNRYINLHARSFPLHLSGC